MFVFTVSRTLNNQTRKRHININFFVRLVLGRPGFVQGFHRACPRDKPGENLGQTRVFSLFYTVEARFHRVKDKPGDEGRHRKFMWKKFMCLFCSLNKGSWTPRGSWTTRFSELQRFFDRKSSRRLELSISKKTPHMEGGDKMSREKDLSEDHDHMWQKAFLSESWSWSSSFSFPETHFQRTMTICARRFSSGNLSHGHRLFLSQCGQCQPKLRGRFAFPGFRNPRISTVSTLGAL